MNEGRGTRLRCALLGVLALGAFAAQVRLLSIGGGPVLWPLTDAFEYASMAHWMVQGEGPVLRIGPAFLPARVPPTLSVLLLPQAWLDGDPRRLWLSIFAIGAAALAGCFVLARALGLSRTAAAISVAVLTTSPAFALYSGVVMSDVPNTAAWLLLCGCALRLMRRGGDDAAALAGVGLACGLLLALRVSNGIWVVALALAFPAVCWKTLLRRPAALGAALAIGALPVAALAWHQLHVFGSPLLSGYHFWLDRSGFFGWRHAIGADGGAAFYAAQLAGLEGKLFARAWTSDLYTLPVAALGAAGLVALLRSPSIDASARRIGGAAVAAGLAAAVFHATYRWREARFLLPLVPFVAIGCGFACTRFGPLLGTRGALGLAAATIAISELLLVFPAPGANRLMPALAAEIERVRAAPDDAGAVRATRMPLALAALFVPRSVVLAPACGEEPIVGDVQRKTIPYKQLPALRVDPGHEARWDRMLHDADVEGVCVPLR